MTVPKDQTTMSWIPVGATIKRRRQGLRSEKNAKREGGQSAELAKTLNDELSRRREKAVADTSD